MGRGGGGKRKGGGEVGGGNRPAAPVAAATKAAGRNTPERQQAAAVKRLDRAFAKSRGAKRNFVSLDEFRGHLGGTREGQDRMIRQGRLAGKYTLDTHEGLSGPSTASQKAAAIHDGGGNRNGYIYISRG